MSLVARRPVSSRWSRRRIGVVAIAVIVMAVLAGGAGYAASQLLRRGVAVPPGGGAAPVAASPTPSPSAAASPTPGSPPPSALAGLSCTIAVAGRWAPGSGGFLTFPGASFRADPTSAVTTPDGGFYGLTHVLALNRWVPVERDWVTPDGTRYAYISWSYGPTLKLVAANGSEQTLPLPSLTTATGARLNLSWRLLAVEADGIYVAADTYAGQPGLWRVGYDGQVKRIASDGYWQAVGYGNAYGTATPSVPEGAANVIVRLALATGARTDVFTQPGLAASVFGFDADGNPVVQGRRGDQAEIWLARAGNPVKLLSFPFTPPGLGGGQGGGPGWLEPGLVGLSAIGDSHGLWIATTHGLHLYTPAAGSELASEVAGPLGSTCR